MQCAMLRVNCATHFECKVKQNVIEAFFLSHQLHVSVQGTVRVHPVTPQHIIDLRAKSCNRVTIAAP